MGSIKVGSSSGARELFTRLRLAGEWRLERATVGRAGLQPRWTTMI
jgi:hypothetical protein